MKFTTRNCLKNPLVGSSPSQQDIQYLSEMRKFIQTNLSNLLAKYLKNDFHIGYIGLTGHTFDEIKLNDINYKLSTIDINKNNNPTYFADITKNNKKIIKDELFDIVICTEVLEHTNNPINAIFELTRILKTDGYLILSTPYNFRIHGPLPDNFRFTEWFYKYNLIKNYNIIDMVALENSNRSMCPINYFITSQKKKVAKNKNKVKKGIVFPSGSGVAVEIFDSLKHVKDIELILINSEKTSQTNCLFDTHYDDCPTLKNVKKLINYLNKIIIKEDIDFIIPAMDECHLILSENSHLLENVKIISSNYATNNICFNKKNTYDYFKNIIKCPYEYKINDQIQFPIFIKPKIGYSSKGCRVIKNNDELKIFNNENMLALEYLPGVEYTVDCFSYKNDLLYCSPRMRKLTKAGLSINTEIVSKLTKLYSDIYKIAKKINNNLDFCGAWFFQLKKDINDELSLLEISTRIAGASSINRIKNVNLSLLSIYAHFNYPIEISENSINNINVTKVYTSLINTEFINDINNIYIDLDDTLIVNEKVNIDCIKMIYKYTEDKNIYLITRHAFDIETTLFKFKININLFDEIIHIQDINKQKIEYVKDNSILFDDSFKERELISKQLDRNIYAFDVSCFSFF